MARPKKYTPDRLSRALDRYFASISREKTVTELVPTGELDKYGHTVSQPVPVTNRLGEPMTVTEFLEPPTVEGLCLALGIHRSTWAEWCDPQKHPEFSDATTRARGLLRGYLERELLSREGKNVRGVEFALSANYGVSAKQTVELGPRAAAAAVASGADQRGGTGPDAIPLSDRAGLLREIARQFQDDDGQNA